MQVGVNYPCYDAKDGLWFGPTAEDASCVGRDWTEGTCLSVSERVAWRSSFRELVSELASLGVSLLRVFLLGNAHNYGRGYGERYEPPPAGAARFFGAYADHLEEILGECQRVRLRVIPVLVSFTAFSRGRRERLLADAAARDAFLERVLEPMLERSERFRRGIAAWEPVNEPNWCTSYALSSWGARLGAWNLEPSVPLANMQSFLLESARRIRAHAFPVTIGVSFGRACRLLGCVPLDDERWLGLRGDAMRDVRQLHYYPLAWRAGPLRIYLRSSLPPSARSGDALLGEISSAAPDWRRARSTRDPQYLPWRDLRGADEGSEYAAVSARLRRAAELGYATTCLWPNRDHRAGDPESLLSFGARRAVQEFVAQQPPESHPA